MRKIFLICCIILCCGCANAVNKKLTAIDLVEVTGNCVDPIKFKAGGKLGILAFKAGPQAEANEQLDHVSSLLIKGIRKILEDAKTVLVITDEASNADLVLEGYIEELYQAGRFSRLILRKKNARLSISGEIWQKGKGTKTLTFASSRKIKVKSKVDEDAYQMGIAIGKFIVDQLSKEQL